MTKSNLLILLAFLALFLLAGCDSNPTNEASPQAIKDADVKRAAAIDADPKMSDADKKKMKEMLHLSNDSAAPTDKRGAGK